MRLILSLKVPGQHARRSGGWATGASKAEAAGIGGGGLVKVGGTRGCYSRIAWCSVEFLGSLLAVCARSCCQMYRRIQPAVRSVK